jgi:hypothetical protein
MGKSRGPRPCRTFAQESFPGGRLACGSRQDGLSSWVHLPLLSLAAGHRSSSADQTRATPRVRTTSAVSTRWTSTVVSACWTTVTRRVVTSTPAQAVGHHGRRFSPESRYPWGRRAGVKMGRAARRRRCVLGRWRPCLSLAPGPDSRVAHCCHEHAGQSFGIPTEPRAARDPSPVRQGGARCQTANRSRSMSTRRSWAGSPRSTTPRRPAWSVPGCPMPPRRASAAPRSGRSPRLPTRSWSWPTTWSGRGWSGSWWSPPPTIGGRSSTCWRRGAGGVAGQRP